MVVRQVGNDVHSDTLRKVLLFGVAAHICKGQYCDRRLLRWRPPSSWRRSRRTDRFVTSRTKKNAVRAHRPSDVLNLLFAHALERKIELVTHLIVHNA